MKKLNVAALNLEGKIQTLEHIFDNMAVKASGESTTGYMLGGDTGVGKTSFVRDLVTLLGMRLVIIETPHIVEEHIIDIPFIVINPNSGGSKTQHMTVDTKSSGERQFDIKFAKSNLHTALVSATKESDAALLASVAKRADLMQIWEHFGGTAKKIPPEIAQLRAKFEVILFLDEYFRQTSNAIRNMLRSILNGRIGSNDLPPNVYVIFASNLVDQGVGDILENEDFMLLNFDKPKTDDWFAYMMAKYKDHKKIRLDEDLVEGLYELMKKHEKDKSNPKHILSHDDEEADVRISPRRWEQLLIYISSHLPVKDQRAADLLMKNIEVSFKHYQTGAKAELAKDVEKLVADIIEKQSGKKIKAVAGAVADADWRDTLKHQVEAKMRMGEDRKYIPVIGGLPGAGKTMHIAELALEVNLIPVFVDVQNLSPEEVIGTPIAEKADDEMKVDFSRPPLYDAIMEQIKRRKDWFPKALEKAYGAEEAKKRMAQYAKQDAKYLIFFDELNRTNTKVFNAIRKVILEKEFTDEYKLPDGSVVVAAINPTGKGTTELTKHVRDVFDVIPVGISWNKFKDYLNKEKLGVDDQIADIAKQALFAFVEHFRMKSAKGIDGADPHFYLQIGPTPLYISAREYKAILSNSARALQRAYNKEMDLLADPEHDAGESEARIRKALGRSFSHGPAYTVMVKHGVDAPEFANELEEWFEVTDAYSLGSIFKKKVESVRSLEDILSKPFANMDDDLFNDLEFVNYINSVEPTIFKEDLAKFLTNHVVTDFQKAFDKTHKLKKLDIKKKATAVTDKEVSKIEFITREILHAIKFHNIRNDMLNMVVQAVRAMLEDIADENTDAIDEIMDFVGEITTFIKTLQKN